MIPVDYSDKESIKSALAGTDVVISTIASVALGLQAGIAEAAKEVGVKLFIPSEFGRPTEGETEGLFGSKARVQDQLKAVGIPYALVYTGAFADIIWAPYVASSLMSLLRHSIYRGAGTWASTSQVGKYLLVAMAASVFRSLPDLTLRDTFPMF